MGLISLTENDLIDDNATQDNSASLLHATKDPFHQAAAFNWSSSFFRIRGLDNEYGKTLINGIVMNKVLDGRPQWSNWGGLNDATRNQLSIPGSAPSDITFGGILGSQNISTRASHIRTGTKIGVSGANTNYNYRPYFIHSSGINKKGWAYVLSTSYRGSNEGYWQGTNYDALSLFTAIEKKINDQHTLNFTAIHAQNKRAKNSPITDEYKNFKYNSYWGYQNEDKRNARIKNVQEPILMLTHYWKINNDTNLLTTLAYQFGHITNTRLGYIDGMNPDPANYKYMPSYYLNRIESQYWSMNTDEFNNLPDEDEFKIATNSLLEQAESAKTTFTKYGQVDWGWIYNINLKNNGISKIILYEDRQQDNTLHINTNYTSHLTSRLILNTGINYRKLNSSNFQKAIDLLGGGQYRDQDTYQSSSKKDSDLHNPNRLIKKGDKFGYNYNINANVLDAFIQFIFNYDNIDFYIAQRTGYTAYQRNGLYKNGVYPNNSYGKSDLIEFSNIGFKGGATYYLTGKHSFTTNLAYYNNAPTIRNTFASARMNNTHTKGITNEKVQSIDMSYTLRTTNLKAKISTYSNTIKNATQINFYYADGVGITDAKGDLLNTNGGAFVTEALTNVNKRNIGLELGLEYKISQTVKAVFASSLGHSTYTNTPKLTLLSDNTSQSYDFGSSNLKSYKTSNGPQTALLLGLEYRAPTYWWLTVNINYLDHNYTNISALRRTKNFVLNPNTGQPFEALTYEQLRTILKQEQLPSVMTLNLTGGKSWRLPNRTYLGFFASINNLLNKEYKTGGFEQARNANYEREIANTRSGQNTFANKYWYAYGRNVFINIYYNF